MDANNTIYFRRPASFYGDPWRGALPCGNGKTGILMHGWVSRENIVINNHALWCDGITGEKLPDISSALEDTRKAVDCGEYKKANNMISSALAESGFRSAHKIPVPLGSLRITFPVEKAFSAYRRGINMETGEIFAEFDIGGDFFERKMFVSRADDIAVVKISGSTPHENFLWLEPQNNFDPASAQYIARLAPSRKSAADTDENRGFYCYSADIGQKTFGMAMRVSGAAKIKKLYQTEAGADTLNTYGENITVLIKTFVTSSGETAGIFGDMRKMMDGIARCFESEELYDVLLERHAALHKPLYESVKLRLPDKTHAHDTPAETLLDEAYDSKAPNLLLEQLWKFGRYLFICGTAEDSNPFPLYGLWHGTYNLPWCAHVANENVQMIYWHAYAGGLEYAYRALIKYYTSELGSYRLNAKNIFGCRGIHVPVYTSPENSQPCVAVPVITNYIGAAGWLACMFHDYYLYTGDLELLESDILPFMYETALFYEDYVKYDENGKCLICPSVSPENTPANLMPDEYGEFMGHPCPSVKNSTMDFAIMKDLFSRLISLSFELDEKKYAAYKEKIRAWAEIVLKIPEYMINSDGAVKEWMSPDLDDNYNHRHLSHIYPVFPGNEINCRTGGPLFGAFKKAVELRLLRGQSGWSLAHMSCIWSRLKEAGKAVECLDTLAKGCLGDNLFTTHNDYRHMGASMDLGGAFAPVQLDANMGAVNAIQEMLLRHSGGRLFVLPAVDFSRIEAGFVENMRFIGGEADISWEGGKLEFTLRARRGLKLSVVLPEKYGGAQIEIDLKQRGEYTYRS